MNAYAYVDSNPLTFIDKRGLCKFIYQGKGGYGGYYYGRSHMGGLWYTSNLSCTYECTSDGSSTELVSSSQWNWYTDSMDVRNGTCANAIIWEPEYDFAGFHTGYVDKPFGEFDPRGSGIPELKE